MARDPDEHAVVLFRQHAIMNEAKTRAEGRLQYEDIDVVEIRFPGSRSVSVFPATAFSHWTVDPMTGQQVQVSYAERFAHQYRQFRAREMQTKTGTPLQYAPFLTEARRAELRALNVYTVEQLAAIEGLELKNLGQGGRELKNLAMDYIAEAKKGAPNFAMEAELEAMRARNQVLEDDLKAVKEKLEREGEKSGDDNFDNMTLDQLRDFITSRTGHAPHGSLNRKTLVRMASETAAAQ